MKNLTFKIENGKWQVANFGTALAIVKMPDARSQSASQNGKLEMASGKF